jgi:energy-coupling factor transport system ATP-binding protein
MEIKVSNLSYKYPNNNTNTLENINIDFLEGKVNGIIGSNGSGKTTLIEVLAGIKKPTNGDIYIDNKIVKKYDKELRKNIGFIFQTTQNHFFKKTVKEEIELACINYNYRINELEKRVLDVIKMVDLNKSYLDRDPFTLSNSESKKLALASVLIYNPKVIIMDEPTIGLDNKSKNNLIKIIRILKNRYKKTIIIVSHDTEFLHKISDKIILIEKGKIIKEGTKYEIFTDVRELKKYGIISPKVIQFSYKVFNKKNIKLGYRDEVNDLVKDIFRNVY